MADDMKFDFTEIDQLAANLGEVRANSGKWIRSAVEFTSVKVKKNAAKRVGARKYFKGAAGAIDYEVSIFQGFGASVLKSEVGYNKTKKPGRLGNLAEFGAPNSSYGPLVGGADLFHAMKDNEADFQKGLGDALRDAEKEAGL